MAPRKPSDKRTVEVEVKNIHAPFNPETQSYVTGLECGPDDRVTVVDFAETWQNESAIVTVAVARG
jgi:hypothetical protein